MFGSPDLNHRRGHAIKLVQIIALLLFVSLLCMTLSSCSRSDKDLINSRINKFLKAYNNGDLEAVLKCLDAQTRAPIELALKLGGAIGSKLTGIDIDLSEMFGLGVGLMAEGDVLTVSQLTINIENKTNATADCLLGYKAKAHYWSEAESTFERARFLMVKKGSDWLIKDIISLGEEK